MLGLFLLQPISTLADGDIEMKVSTGIGGEYKPSQWVSIEVEVTNKGNDVEGDLLVEVTGHYDSSGTYYQPLTVVQGATKKVTLFVPGNGLNSNTEVKLVSNGQELAKQKIGGRNLGDETLFVGVLASTPDTANFLATLPKDNFPMPTRVTSLKAEDIPDLAAPLKSLSMLIINNFSMDQFSQEQIQAIAEWTDNGGLLVLAGGAHYEKVSGTMDDLAPVKVEGTTQINNLEVLTKSIDSTIELQQPFTVSKATSHSGKVLYQVDNVPLFVVDDVGSGKVLYVAYDLAEEPLANWSGNSSFWAQALLQVNGSSFATQRMGVMEQWWPLNSAADRIPSLKLPNTMVLALIFGIYILFVGPILYFLLKRKGKREWIWFIVPTLACVLAVGIYFYGSIERTSQVLSHNVSFVELDGQGEAKLSAASAIFVPKGGDYTFRLNGNGIVLPSNAGYSSNNEQQVSNTWVSLTSEQAQVSFKNVEFWSMRKASIQKNIEDIGEITSNLRYTEGKLVGTVTNNTGLALRDVRLFHGRHAQDFETVEPGETLQVELDFDTAIQPGRGLSGQNILPQHMQNNEVYFREQRMVDMLSMNSQSAIRHSMYQTTMATPIAVQPDSLATPIIFLGWTEEKVYDFEVVGHEKTDNNLALVKAELEVQPSENGYVFYPAGTFDAILTESNVQVDHTGDGYMLPGGEITFEFQFYREQEESQKKLDLEKIHMYTWSNDNTRFAKQVYNWQTEEYEVYEEVFEKNKLLKEKMDTYISEEGLLRMKMEHQMDGYRHLGQPAVSVEGKVLE